MPRPSPIASKPAEARDMALAEILRHARRAQAISQLELALRLGVSQRHLSFIEIGRARPSRELLLAWLEELSAPGWARNAALLTAGFAPTCGSRAAEAPADAERRSALEQLVTAHEPFPAIVFNADWLVELFSRGGLWLCGQVMPDLPEDLAAPGRGLDMIATVGHPQGLLSRARQPAYAAAALLRQFEAEAWVRPALRARVQACARALANRYGDLPPDSREPGAPYLNLTFDTAVGPLTFFTIQTVFGLPQNVTVEALRAELWFPADEFTRARMIEAAAAAA